MLLVDTLGGRLTGAVVAGEGMMPLVADRSSEDFYSASEAAMVLGVSKRTVLNWLNDGTLDGAQDPETGRWSIPAPHVYELRQRREQEQRRKPTPPVEHDATSRELVEALQSQVKDLRERLDREQEANRENRRIIAGLMNRIPELPAPQEQSAPPDERGSSESASEESSKGAPPESSAEPQAGAQRRSWWREFFGF